ncbi:type II toxin-antitoxin system PemK/MazF family toxin [Micromonospora sp. WMMD1102]|uniref:type II toxin-antitoxin system PemK/MazF family toxin n=1 Tax=Micromonospora sp. WMMD1102 TaxID=3016105 RepID=UPI0024154FA3|nr:type II toxin-antitoxin system PemK/MazF family toxin [Micromonospora sp. WMMD1102]MDG4792093.1 type II toxin-antitoxin system PemK/MazF family toxin [Micromonospora sp. WMMD1102]
MRRGDVYSHATFDRQFVIVSTDRLTESGTVIVVEISPEVPAGTRGMLAVALTDTEPVHGAVLAWRVNYVKAERLGKHLGALSAEAIDMVDMALRTAMDL